MKHISTLFIILIFLSNIVQAQTIITYDKLGRVTHIQQEDGTEIDYTYDAVGNRLTEEVIVSSVCVKSAVLIGTPKPSLVGFSTMSPQTTGWPSNLNNAFLVLESKEKGFVITRMANPELTIGTGVNAVQGMIVYDTDDNCLKMYNGTSWGCITQGCPD